MKMIRYNRLTWSVCCAFFIITCASTVFTRIEINIMKSKRRTALVIGNRDYRSTTSLRKLKNPINDANDVADILEKLEFEVVKKCDVDKKEMENSIKNFGEKLKKGGVGLFYYAGHGFQINGVNYLIPIESIHMESPHVQREIEKKAVSIDWAVMKMDNAGNDFNIVILDACRSSPFGIRAPIPIVKGFSEIEAPKTSRYGVFIVYAAAPGETAADGEGINGIFTEHLLENIGKPGLELENLITIVTDRVREVTGGRQTPWRGGWKGADFYFNLNKDDVSKVLKICELPRIITRVGYTDHSTIKKSAGAFGNSYDDAFKKAKTKVVRKFFNRCPTHQEYKNAVYGIHRLRETRMPDDSFFVEVSIEFYLKEEK